MRLERPVFVVNEQGMIMIAKRPVEIADLDVELSAIGGYDSASGVPCGCLHGPIRPFIRPESAGEVTSLVTISAE